MEVKIEHQAQRIHEALGIKSDYKRQVLPIVQSYFVNDTEDGPGHGKASQALVEAIIVAKDEVFKAETPINEYEATLIYLGYLVGAEITAHRERMQGLPFGGAMPGLPPNHPLAAMLGQILSRRRPEASPEGGDESGSFLIKCNSPEEAQLHKDIMIEMSKGNMTKALQLMMKLKDIKEGNQE